MFRSYHAAMLALLWGIDANTETNEIWALIGNLIAIVFWAISIFLIFHEMRED